VTRAPNAAGPTAYRPTIGEVRVMFFTYLAVIVSGITFFTVVGLTHH
jgi:hypothetical protein